VLMIGCLPSNSTVSPHRDRVNLEMHTEAGIERVGRCNWRLRLREFPDAIGERDRRTFEMDLEAAIE